MGLDYGRQMMWVNSHGDKTDKTVYAMSSLLNGEIDSADKLKALISQVYEDIVGKRGKSVFLRFVLPGIIKIHKDNFRGAGIRLLGIIEDSKEINGRQINNFLREAIHPDEFEFVKKPESEKAQILVRAIRVIQELILKSKKWYGTDRGIDYEGIIAAIIHGSFAKGTFHLHSDLDVVPVAASAIKKHFFEDKGMEIDYEASFGHYLELTLQREVHLTHGSIFIEDEVKLRELAQEKKPYGIGNEYLVISPFEQSRKQIEKILKGAKKWGK